MMSAERMVTQSIVGNCSSVSWIPSATGPSLYRRRTFSSRERKVMDSLCSVNMCFVNNKSVFLYSHKHKTLLVSTGTSILKHSQTGSHCFFVQLPNLCRLQRLSETAVWQVRLSDVRLQIVTDLRSSCSVALVAEGGTRLTDEKRTSVSRVQPSWAGVIGE